MAGHRRWSGPVTLAGVRGLRQLPAVFVLSRLLDGPLGLGVLGLAPAARVTGCSQRRQNMGVNSTRTVKISSRPSTMAADMTHLAKVLTSP